MAERLRLALRLHGDVDGTAHMFEKMTLDADYKNRYAVCAIWRIKTMS